MAGSLDGLTSGQSSRLNILDPDGKVLTWGIISNLTYAEKADILEKTPMDGITLLPKLHKLWQGTFRYFRTDNLIMDYIIEQENNYYLGGDQLPLSIHHSILEINGSTTQLQFSNVVVMLENAGDYSGTDIVEQTVSWKGSRISKST